MYVSNVHVSMMIFEIWRHKAIVFIDWTWDVVGKLETWWIFFCTFSKFFTSTESSNRLLLKVWTISREILFLSFKTKFGLFGSVVWTHSFVFLWLSDFDWFLNLLSVAPETVYTQTVSPKSDMFALGCLIYEIYTKECLINCNNDIALYKQQVANLFPLKLEKIPMSLHGMHHFT